MAELDDPIGVSALGLDFAPTKRELAELNRLGRQFSTTMVSAFEGIAVRGKGVNEVLRSLALSLSNLVLKAALRPLGDAFGGLLQGLFAGGFGFAKGGVLQHRMPVPFASGGVIQSPLTFPLAQGQMGLAGERGAEAILPLARGPDGRLGVAAQGGSGIAVTFNVTSPDAESFRRSESQVAAMVARAVALGQRNL
jgi:phage-related minor tail protein